MTPTFIANLRLSQAEPLSTTLLWALALTVCTALAWYCARGIETQGRPGAQTMVALGGLIGFGMMAVPCLFMIVMRVWAALYFA